MAKILLVDDDEELCELLVELLATEGFSVSAVHDGEAGVEAARSVEYELVLLDVTLPKLNGFEVLRILRQESQIPVLMLTARGDDVDRIVGLEIGADDYLAKPYQHRELVARVKAILRRTRQPQERALSRKKHMNIDNLFLNLANHEVFVDSAQLDITATEFVVLKTLVERVGELVTREELTQIALSRSLESFDRAIDMHVSNLRRKIGSKPDGRPRLKTVRGSGYFYIGE